MTSLQTAVCTVSLSAVVLGYEFEGVLFLFILLINISLAVPMECKVLSASQRLDDSVVQNVYLEAGDDDALSAETILLRTQRNNVYVSYDGGIVFHQIELRDKGRIIDIIVNKHFPAYVYLITVDGYIYISSNGAVSFKRVKAPSKRSVDFALMKNPLSFHKYDPKKFIYAGMKGCHFWNNVADCRTSSVNSLMLMERHLQIHVCLLALIILNLIDEKCSVILSNPSKLLMSCGTNYR
ncbi:Hypothetical protein PAS_chr3_0326 [Komagataella phaffii GS115]|uniref:Sortilin N-terminal domain-containing protein n=1 Tax=Komagataella phaffii (strain GS115 / ATCC 20864) TaxID=644223 RepID=C4R478_KOMPG|nr:Hypothetical protein PAS_chr3_0326 [Komagataella phaffii GS115]CAY70364.1 Hypothetical protein PAS_chr3_0326 [Komagataella phaffii GS115]